MPRAIPLPIPMIEQLRQGSWKGWISYEKTAENPRVWSGQYELQNAVVEIPGLASPVHIASALVQMSGDETQITRMHGRAGTVKFDGEYRLPSLRQRIRIGCASPFPSCRSPRPSA